MKRQKKKTNIEKTNKKGTNKCLSITHEIYIKRKKRHLDINVTCANK